MADYQLTTSDPNGPVLRTADQVYIPADPANRDWQDYQQFLADGGVPDAYVPPPEPEPQPDPNKRIDEGVIGAVEAWNANPLPPEVLPAEGEADAPLASPSVEELQARVTRLEETVKSMCEGQMEHLEEAPEFIG